MENMGPLEKWLLANAAVIDLQIRYFDNELLDLAGMFDLEAEIKVENKKYSGRGTAFDKEVALKKACSEAIERFFLHKNKFSNSNGMAAHTSGDLAIESATLELIERDLFLCRYLTQTPFLKFQHDNGRLEKLERFMNKRGVTMSFYSMGMINSVRAVLCAIDGLESPTPFGYILGSSAGDINSAIESSFMEAYRNFAHHKSDQSISVMEFARRVSQGKIDFKDHGNLALDFQYAEKIKKDYFISADSVEINETINLDLRREILSMDDTPFRNAPLAVCRVTSKLLQDLYTGPTTAFNLNGERLKRFCTAYARNYQIVEIPHPFN